MTVMRLVLLALVSAAAALVLPVTAGAEPLPSYDGAMTFQTIQGPEGPEEFSWEVNLRPDQELRQVDEEHAQVYYTDPEEHPVFEIPAIAAHDSVGRAVPTTISVTQPNIITLSVHHRTGNPAAGGAPFDYPVNAGSGWEGGIQVHQVQGPPDETEARTRENASAPLAPTCIVPDLGGRTLRATRKMLKLANCKLGPVRGERMRGARVVRQYRVAGKSLPLGTEVGVKVLRP